MAILGICGQDHLGVRPLVVRLAHVRLRPDDDPRAWPGGLCDPGALWVKEAQDGHQGKREIHMDRIRFPSVPLVTDYALFMKKISHLPELRARRMEEIASRFPSGEKVDDESHPGPADSPARWMGCVKAERASRSSGVGRRGRRARRISRATRSAILNNQGKKERGLLEPVQGEIGARTIASCAASAASS